MVIVSLVAFPNKSRRKIKAARSRYPGPASKSERASGVGHDKFHSAQEPQQLGHTVSVEETEDEKGKDHMIYPLTEMEIAKGWEEFQASKRREVEEWDKKRISTVIRHRDDTVSESD